MPPKKKVQKVKKVKAPKVHAASVVKKNTKKKVAKKSAKKKPAKEKMAAEILTPENFARVQKVVRPLMSLTVWFSELQPKDFEKEIQRLKTFKQIFMNRMDTFGNKMASDADTKLFRRFMQFDEDLGKLMRDYSDYIDVLDVVDKKGAALLERIVDKKNQDQVIADITKLEALYTPVFEHLMQLKKRCDALPAMIDGLVSAVKRDIN
jgi:hypothetical protein